MHTPNLDRLSAEDRTFHRKLMRRLAMTYGTLALALMLWVVVSPSLRQSEEATVARDLAASAVGDRTAR